MFGGIECRVRFFKQGSEVLGSLVRQRRNAKTDRDMERPGGMYEREGPDRDAEPFRHSLGVLRVGLKEQDREFLSAIASDEITAAAMKL